MDDLSAIAKALEGGSDLVTYLIIYVAYRINTIERKQTEHDTRLKVLELKLAKE